MEDLPSVFSGHFGFRIVPWIWLWIDDLFFPQISVVSVEKSDVSMSPVFQSFLNLANVSTFQGISGCEKIPGRFFTPKKIAGGKSGNLGFCKFGW